MQIVGSLITVNRGLKAFLQPRVKLSIWHLMIAIWKQKDVGRQLVEFLKFVEMANCHQYFDKLTAV